MKRKQAKGNPLGITLRQAYDLLYWLYEEVGPHRKLMRRTDDGQELRFAQPNRKSRVPWVALPGGNFQKRETFPRRT